MIALVLFAFFAVCSARPFANGTYDLVRVMDVDISSGDYTRNTTTWLGAHFVLQQQGSPVVGRPMNELPATFSGLSPKLGSSAQGSVLYYEGLQKYATLSVIQEGNGRTLYCNGNFVPKTVLLQLNCLLVDFFSNHAIQALYQLSPNKK